MDELVQFLFRPATPLWIAALFVIGYGIKIYPLVLEKLNEARRDRAAISDSRGKQWQGEISRLDERCNHLQREVDDCREREGEWMRRAIAAEAALLGEGDARQNAQRIVSTEREADAAVRKGKA